MSRQRKADLLLVLATGFWGVSYYLLDLCLTELPPLTAPLLESPPLMATEPAEISPELLVAPKDALCAPTWPLLSSPAIWMASAAISPLLLVLPLTDRSLWM